MTRIHCIDLLHLDLEGAIAAYLLEGPEPTVIDPGPATTVPRLQSELAARGVGPRDLRHVVLTHVHLDHGGGTGHVLRAFPEATVHVHEDGAPHVADPRRLVASTRRTFGDDHDRLWGETLPVPADRIRGWRPGEAGPWRGLRPIATPGHIAHHVAYLEEAGGTLLAGDSMGIVLAPGAPTHPPTPPPSVDARAWETTLDEIAGIGPERFGATHFGLHGEATERTGALRSALAALESRVRAAMAADDDQDAERFEEEVRAAQAAHLDRARVDRYFDMFAAATDWAGMHFYLERNG